jgi:hypothetical protein
LVRQVDFFALLIVLLSGHDRQIEISYTQLVTDPLTNLGALGGLAGVLVGLIYMLGRGVLISGRSVDRLEAVYQSKISMLEQLCAIERQRGDKATELLDRALRTANLTDRVLTSVQDVATARTNEGSAT